jgi:hypothetical protein
VANTKWRIFVDLRSCVRLIKCIFAPVSFRSWFGQVGTKLKIAHRIGRTEGLGADVEVLTS